MNTDEILKNLDDLFEKNEPKAAEELLLSSIEEAEINNEFDAVLILTNEAMGYYRESGQNMKAIDMCHKALDLVNVLGLENTIPYATTLLNIANVHRSAGLLHESLQYYKMVLPIYNSNKDTDPLYIASLHNNISLLFQEMNEFQEAKKELLKASEIINGIPDAKYEQAVTYANLANTCTVLKQNEEALNYAGKAINIFEEIGTRDSHYSSALAALGSIHYTMGNYEASLNYFNQSKEIIKKNLGTENQQYERILENIEVVEKTIDEEADKIIETMDASKPKEEEKTKLPKEEIIDLVDTDIKGMELCEQYYKIHGLTMLQKYFSEYREKIAVGLFGKGSDCFGYDDKKSRDHDFGPRFVMLLDKETYENIGESLQICYENLPDEFGGIKRIETFHGRDRAGVFIVEDYFKSILGTDLCTDNTYEEWANTPSYALAAAVNGKLFIDEVGTATKYREELKKYYPKAIWYRKLAQAMALFSQSGQYNLFRMLGRGQNVSAVLAKAECLREAMHLSYLLLREYAPHDKWLFKGLENLSGSIGGVDIHATHGVISLIAKLADMPIDMAHEKELKENIETLAVLFADELTMQNIVALADVYLDANTTEIMIKSNAMLQADDLKPDTDVIYNLAEIVAKMEFEAFDKVKNEGGRASCQDDWTTFKYMRMSQYMTWNQDMLLQYIYDFKINMSKGRNLIEEKYARMMKSTAPEEYAKFKDKLPEISEDKNAILEEIVKMQVEWMESFAKEYPRLAANARYIHTSDDNMFDTSYETYLRGELGTYSDKMLELYGRYIVEHATSNKNVAEEIIKNTVHFYGYDSFEEANEKI